MKMKPEHYETIRAAIAACPFKPADGVSPMRYRWDVLKAAKVGGNTARWICDNLYPYLNDSHIDTALRRYFGHSA